MWCKLRIIIIRINLYSFKLLKEKIIYLVEKGMEEKRKEKKE